MPSQPEQAVNILQKWDTLKVYCGGRNPPTPVTKPATPRLRVRRRPPPAPASYRRRNLTLAALVLLTGVGASVFGFQFGQSALEDVSAPKSALGDARKPLGKSKGLLKEAQILGSLTTMPDPSDTLTEDQLLEQQEDLAAEDTSEAKIRLGTAVSDENVTFTLDSVAWRGSNLVLQVGLQNKSFHPARFIYSPAFNLLVITDDQGKPVRTFSEGLPGELPADRELYKGTIQISASDIDKAQALSLSLADYPDRELQFLVDTIPIPPAPPR
ncbi:gll0886 [Gloeobacter violaceus PCC 7421]|uniref:Gll0886 protein n=1 Tax=Gloeobacter violaceus (strain ATCC 29082 / PCC 7421) TaxID=251221 RepID=Q7NM81_GLOVI|nr:gll0886 [Gloeobacter violaceus PCC 7421]